MAKRTKTKPKISAAGTQTSGPELRLETPVRDLWNPDVGRNDVVAALRTAVHNAGLYQSEIAKLIDATPVQVTRWLDDKSDRAAVPVSAVEDIAKQCGFESHVILVRAAESQPSSVAAVGRGASDSHGGDRSKAWRRASVGGGSDKSWTSDFCVALAFARHERAPTSIVQLVAQLAGASSALLYMADLERNILTCDCTYNVRQVEYMEGFSWNNEVPSRAIRLDHLVEPELGSSAFAVREQVEKCIAVPIHTAARGLLIINFEKGKAPQFQGAFAHWLRFAGDVLQDILDYRPESAKVALLPSDAPLKPEVARGAGGDAAGRAATGSAIDSGAATGWNTYPTGEMSGRTGIVQARGMPIPPPHDPAVGILRSIFSGRGTGVIGPQLAEELAAAAQQIVRVSGSGDVSVYGFPAPPLPGAKDRGTLSRLVRVGERRAGHHPHGDAAATTVDDLRKDDGDISKIVRESGDKGSTYYSGDVLESQTVWSAAEHPGPAVRAKLTVPFRCEEILIQTDVVKDWVGENEGHETLRTRDSTKGDIRCFGVLDIESSRRFGIAHEAVYALGRLANLAATALWVRWHLEQDEFRDPFGPLLEAVIDILQPPGPLLKSRESVAVGMTAYPPGSRSTQLDAVLNPLCNAITSGQPRLFPLIDRFDIWCFNHTLREFNCGGFSVTHEIRAKHEKALGTSDDDDYLQHIQPRLGGNSYTLIGINNEYRIIADAQRHKRLNRSSRPLGFQSLIGASFRNSASFMSDGVVWLGSHEAAKKLQTAYLTDNGNANLRRLQIVMAISGIFASLLRGT